MRRAVLIVSAELAILFAGSTLLTPLYQVYQRAFGFSVLTLTLVYAVYAVGNAIALLLLGRLSDQLGRRRVALAALAGAGASSALYLVAPGAGLSWLFGGRVLSGAAIGVASGTATAWIAELVRGGDRTRASLYTVTANYAGIAAGPLLSGLLAQYAPAPLRLSHWVYLGLLVVAAPLVARVPETVTDPVRRARDLSLRPRIGVPRTLRAQFVSPAATIFAGFALVGFYAALVPDVLRRDLARTNLAEGGAVVAAMFLAGAAGVWGTRRLAPRRAMLGAVAALFVSLVLLVIAEHLRALPVLLAGTAVGGVAAATCYRGSLQVVVALAPAARRAEVLSSYFLAGFLGNALPVVGVGVLRRFASPETADLCFGAAVAAVTLVALATGLRFAPHEEPSAA